MRYGIRNNKGGVGKTFLSFILGAEYAHEHPDESVILADMCPQANLSEILLGGNEKGGDRLAEILAKGKGRKTIGGYFDLRIESPHHISGSETEFLLRLEEYNSELPKNLYLICGDPSLEIQAQVISQIGGQMLPANAWKNVRSWLHDLLNACSRKLGHETTMTIIDCNPSFPAYTELAMVASDRLIIPCSSDGSSARAIDNVAALLYGFNVSDAYKTVAFLTKTGQFGIGLPLIHVVILNRSTQYNTQYNKEASKAFGAMFEQIKKNVLSFQERDSSRFVSRKAEFEDMPDTHSVSIVCSHHGKPLYSVAPGKYPVHDTRPQVNPEPLERYKKAVEKLLSTL
uniref:AAA domain-containing protein n=1 Tax=Candidatus Kentrum sp. MB TaxID=2138164 RepID=A0A450XM89_9GAMM|nr:MAG: AAA domain-containing protein [Candidatus Kentron sp. MB]VFK34427.1 MAG: AAA domain-containing protein [Candidatus Kentron sp. MB]VFK76698.1 MAG: AAA domain-containing protein [Candidatus Kentron sp. MB]